MCIRDRIFVGREFDRMHVQFALNLLDWFSRHVGRDFANVWRNELVNEIAHAWAGLNGISRAAKESPASDVCRAGAVPCDFGNSGLLSAAWKRPGLVTANDSLLRRSLAALWRAQPRDRDRDAKSGHPAPLRKTSLLWGLALVSARRGGALRACAEVV